MQGRKGLFWLSVSEDTVHCSGDVEGIWSLWPLEHVVDALHTISRPGISVQGVGPNYKILRCTSSDQLIVRLHLEFPQHLKTMLSSGDQEFKHEPVRSISFSNHNIPLLIPTISSSSHMKCIQFNLEFPWP